MYCGIGKQKYSNTIRAKFNSILKIKITVKKASIKLKNRQIFRKMNVS